ncbi:MAG: CHAD domain-containing protein [Sterolibacteriaceae bacterium MAG5]|nr:CHAD domain-containing protein [Candidatus Nitricoxidireducens bremensis]
MADEVELKLALPESAQRALQRLPLLKHAVSRKTDRLINLYYDTPDLDLHKRGIALRLRRQGHRWLQTVKCAGRSAAGLTTRPEWETPYGGDFDFSVVDAEAVRTWLERRKIRARIAPLFETNFLRTTWRFEPRPGTALLLAFDRGWIAAAGRHEAISELEIEIAAGGTDALFDLAGRIAERIPLAPALLSKAERGYRLFNNAQPAPVKAGTVPLGGEMAPLEAFRVIALACLEHLQQNHEGGAASNDPEYIHQMRVAMRRLRAAMRLFRPLLPPEFGATLLPPMREQMTVLGHTRDMDVLLAEIAAPVLSSLAGEPRLAALVGLVTEQRHRQRHLATQALRSPRFGRLMLLATDLLHRPPFQPLPPDGESNLAAFADGRIRRLRRKVLYLAAGAAVDDPTSLHALRIGIKRLRYALEFFAPLAHGKTFGREIAKLSRLQDTLGQINDLANAGRLLMECAGEDGRLREAVTLIGGWHGPRYAGLLASIPAGLKQLRSMKLPRLL